MRTQVIGAIAAGDAPLGALLHIDDQGNSHAGITWPAEIRRGLAISDEIPLRLWLCHQVLRSGFRRRTVAAIVKQTSI